MLKTLCYIDGGSFSQPDPDPAPKLYSLHGHVPLQNKELEFDANFLIAQERHYRGEHFVILPSGKKDPLFFSLRDHLGLGLVLNVTSTNTSSDKADVQKPESSASIDMTMNCPHFYSLNENILGQALATRSVYTGKDASTYVELISDFLHRRSDFLKNPQTIDNLARDAKLQFQLSRFDHEKVATIPLKESWRADMDAHKLRIQELSISHWSSDKVALKYSGTMLTHHHGHQRFNRTLTINGDNASNYAFHVAECIKSYAPK